MTTGGGGQAPPVAGVGDAHEPPVGPAGLVASPLGTHTGTVSAFDEDAGLGTIAWSNHAGAPGEGAPTCAVPFHCTAIADGSRRIEPGTAVTFRLLARHGGRVEAAEIAPCR